MNPDLRSLLPTGSSLSDEDFARRHRVISRVLWMQIPFAAVVGAVNRVGRTEVILQIVPIVVLALVARLPVGRAWRSIVTSMALLGGCGVLIHLTDGLSEMHMLLLVVLVVVALYQDWRAYALAVGFTILRHVVMILLGTNDVFNHASNRTHPIAWAFAYSAIVVFESAVIMVFWKQAEDAQRREVGLRARLFRDESDLQRRLADSERRRAEEVRAQLLNETGVKRMFSAVLEAIPNQVWWRDADMEEMGANSAHLSVRRLVAEASSKREDDPRYAELARAYAELDDMIDTLERRVLLEGRAIQDVHVKIPNPDGSIGTYLIDVLPYHLAGTEASGIIGVATDITHVAELEGQLAQASRLESIGQLAAGVAHEINTPIQFVSDNTTFLSEGFEPILDVVRCAVAVVDGTAPVDRLAYLLDGINVEFIAEEIPAALEQSLEGLQRVTDIVRAMKDYAHPGRGRALTDINRAIETTVQICRNEWKYLADMHLDLDPGVGLVPCFEGDLKQALLNMVVNAAHAIEEDRGLADPNRPGRIAVTTKRLAGEIEITIADDGAGMDDATARRIFDPFFTTKTVGKGTGQGLSLAHATIVHKHGGRIRVDSQRHQGTTFTILLPAGELGDRQDRSPDGDRRALDEHRVSDPSSSLDSIRATEREDSSILVTSSGRKSPNL